MMHAVEKLPEDRKELEQTVVGALRTIAAEGGKTTNIRYILRTLKCQNDPGAANRVRWVIVRMQLESISQSRYIIPEELRA